MRYAVFTVGAVGLLGLVGCSGGDGIAAIDRAATSDDQLPGYVLTHNLDIDSVRQVVEHDGVSYFISEPKELNGFCMIRTEGQNETAWGIACGTRGGKVVTHQTTDSTGVTLVTDGYATDDLEEEGWTKIHDNLLIR